MLTNTINKVSIVSLMYRKLDEDSVAAVQKTERSTGAGVVFDAFLGMYVFN